VRFSPISGVSWQLRGEVESSPPPSAHGARFVLDAPVHSTSIRFLDMSDVAVSPRRTMRKTSATTTAPSRGVGGGLEFGEQIAGDDLGVGDVFGQ
jgi:hypothetical protein